MRCWRQLAKGYAALREQRHDALVITNRRRKHSAVDAGLAQELVDAVEVQDVLARAHEKRVAFGFASGHDAVEGVADVTELPGSLVKQAEGIGSVSCEAPRRRIWAIA